MKEPSPHPRPRVMWKTTCCLAWIGIAAAVTAEEALPKPRLVLPEMEEPALGEDSMRQEEVPAGTLNSFEWVDSAVFPDTRRTVRIYIPAGAEADQPLALMVFQDGHSYVDPAGSFRVPTVLDNLIHAGAIPPMVAVFIDPGHKGPAPAESPWRHDNRSLEYDTLSDAYARFLLEEILPEVEKTQTLSEDPAMRAICGASSGGICAWTVAWERPDAFGKVMSSIGSFTNIRGGDAYPGMIRKTEPKPIRAIFQAGTNDLDNRHGSWPLGNLQMQAALEFMEYDHRFHWGTGAHDGQHAGAIFPDMMRWLWRED